MKKWIIRAIVVIVVAIVALAGIYFYKVVTIPQKVHYHAGFVIFTNNKKVDFSKTQYMSVEPCTLQTHEEEDTPQDIQREKAHLHDSVGDVVHVERSGATWGDLFTNLHYSIDYAQATAYLNGKKIADLAKQEIHNDDSLVVLIGKNDITKELKQAVTKKHIEETAKKSESCG